MSAAPVTPVPRAVVFDLDGVLIDSEPLWHEAELEVFCALGVPLTRALCLETTGLRVDAVVQHWYGLHPWPHAPHERVAADVVGRVAALIRARAQPMPHVHAALDAVGARGLALGLASSSPMLVIDAALARLGIARRFSAVRSAEPLPHGKPDPQVYLLACADLGVAPAAAIAVEDSSSGLRAAHAAGMRVIAVPDPSARPPDALGLADLVIADLGELATALDRLVAPPR
ncbi:MAG: hexitol phosphatase HxpB [Deltaproteobacteria bacterium]|nr:hexitol phosphatase HxpB [Deltaproteobacteria bacterium]